MGPLLEAYLNWDKLAWLLDSCPFVVLLGLQIFLEVQGASISDPQLHQCHLPVSEALPAADEDLGKDYSWACQGVTEMLFCNLLHLWVRHPG